MHSTMLAQGGWKDSCQNIQENNIFLPILMPIKLFIMDLIKLK